MADLAKQLASDSFGNDGGRVETILGLLDARERDAFGAIISRPDPTLREMADFLNACRVTAEGKVLTVTVAQVGAWWDVYSQGAVAKELREHLREYENIPYMSMLEKLLVDTIADISWVTAKVKREEESISGSEALKILPAMRKASVEGIKTLHDMKTHILKDELELGGALLLAEKLRATFQGTSFYDMLDLAINKALLDIEICREP